jgi:glutathione S-transferase
LRLPRPVGRCCLLHPIRVCTFHQQVNTSPYESPDARALVRLQADHVSRTLVPAFYRYLQAQDTEQQIAHGKEFHAALEDLAKLMERTEREASAEPHRLSALGLWKEGGDLGWTDVMAGPCEIEPLSRHVFSDLYNLPQGYSGPAMS